MCTRIKAWTRRPTSSEPPPEGLALPDTFGAPVKLLLESGVPLQLSPYSAVHAADVNGDGRTDLVVSDESGAVRLLPQLASGRFAKPAAVLAGGKALQLPGGPAAPFVADVDRRRQARPRPRRSRWTSVALQGPQRSGPCARPRQRDHHAAEQSHARRTSRA